MRLTKYRLELVKESACNYGGKEYKIKNPWNVECFLRDIYGLDRQTEEVLYCICLDVKNKVVGIHEVSRGTLSASLVHPREIFKRALLHNSNKIILAHNHPSGETNPSNEDNNITKRIRDCGELLGIGLIDHVIIGDGAYYSYKENFNIL